jgi:hypothetical protein
MKKIEFSTEDFSNAFFYAASGTDLQPLLRFSHLVDSFVYVTVDEQLDEREVIQTVRRKLATLQGAYGSEFLELVEEPRSLNLKDFEHETPRDWRKLLTTEFLANYARVFGRFASLENWALEFRFSRMVGNRRRPVRLVYLNGEALATYMALSCNGRVAPRVFCSIQSGVLECETSPMVAYWGTGIALPEFWVRGLHQRRYYEDSGAHDLRVRSAFRPVDQFNFFCQSYEGWSGHLNSKNALDLAGLESRDDSLVRAFARTSSRITIPKRVVFNNRHNRIRIRRERLNLEKASNYDLVLLPGRLSRRWEAAGRNDVSCRAECIQAPPGAHAGMRMPAGVKSCLSKLNTLADDKSLGKIALIPDAYEDEGAALAEWARAYEGDCDVDVYLAEPLDFVDIQQ